MSAGAEIALSTALAAPGLQPVAGYVAGLVLVLATPGPNLLLVGALAALRGFRATIPLAFGLLAGVIAQGAMIYGLSSLVPKGPVWDEAGRLAAAAMLVAIGIKIARAKGPADPSRGGMAVAEFPAGFLTAAGNPVMAGFLGSQFLGPFGDLDPFLVAGAIALAAILVFAKANVVALAMSHAAVQACVAASFVPVSRAVGALFILLAMLMVKPVILNHLG